MKAHSKSSHTLSLNPFKVVLLYAFIFCLVFTFSRRNGDEQVEEIINEEDAFCIPRLSPQSKPLFVRWELKFLPTNKIFFLQIGGNCGKNTPECALGGDPIWEYATQCDQWSGIVIEPAIEAFTKLQSYYGIYSDRILTMRAAIGNENGLFSTGLEDERNKVKKKDVSDIISTDPKLQVPMYSMETLWNFYNFRRRIDILVIDAEGAEFPILSSTIPKPKPRLILFEIAKLRGEKEMIINKSLIEQGYELLADLKHMDAFAVEHDLPAQDRLYGLK